MVADQNNMVLSQGEFDVVGTRPIRHDGPDKVTGRARYAADVHPAAMLHGKILRSPHAHAVIKSIDTTRALALPGIKAVATSADFPDVSAEITDQEEGGQQTKKLHAIGVRHLGFLKKAERVFFSPWY